MSHFVFKNASKLLALCVVLYLVSTSYFIGTILAVVFLKKALSGKLSVSKRFAFAAPTELTRLVKQVKRRYVNPIVATPVKASARAR
ncbi:TPA: hypothetical protein QDB15_006409 [Burkholderia vietnamiensis]|uniref:hypothetical protein n=1 Tax=Burkholderia vietnamiensis TaxID=60552 RepID=UPI00075ACB91|nr:hypothetical protein [Burkholderia vietnamiensis]KVS13683.1 hypothetical protein WK32_31585 [Burkholderia vietnamiensis]MCA8211989.1 hypothetical protein [Burkholderia vietnamiensis]HDR9102700.1 hypothetical protein [Burkholderia vietnamiensis]HDR9122516.1 hypothetical protein [Burkholderia vietnamiensis]HDR9172293.1 hypothetical protein [Burkholderia vietnamiensis]